MGNKQSDTLEQNLFFLQDVIEHLPIGVIVIDRKGRILMMNQWQEKTSQVRREQVLGAYFHEKWDRLFKQGIMTDYWKLLDEGRPFQAILHDIYPQFYDHKISAISRGAPVKGHEAFILLHDVLPEIQQDKRGLELLTRRLDDQNIFLTNLIDSLPNMIITTDRDGLIQSLNRTGEHLLEYEKTELLGLDIGLVFTDRDMKDRLITAEQTGRPLEVTIRKKSEETFPARMQVRKILNQQGQSQAKLFLFTDITYEKVMEEKLALSEKLAIYSELMAGIAHQLNNPLVGVANFASLLLEKTAPDDPNRNLVATIHEASQRCRTMLSTMIKSLREPESTFHLVDLSEVVTRALENVFKNQGETGIMVDTDIRPGLPAIRGDSIQLLEVFRNLMVNAVQAMPRGGRLVVRVDQVKGNTSLLVEIADSGSGVPKNLEEKIFEPFFTTKKGVGAGLGLSFAFRVVQNHGGRIEVRAAAPQGAIFRVSLPVH